MKSPFTSWVIRGWRFVKRFNLLIVVFNCNRDVKNLLIIGLIMSINRSSLLPSSLDWALLTLRWFFVIRWWIWRICLLLDGRMHFKQLCSLADIFSLIVECQHEVIKAWRNVSTRRVISLSQFSSGDFPASINVLFDLKLSQDIWMIEYRV